MRRFDGEFPDKYFDEVMDYLNIKPEEFHKLCDLYRSPHLWSKNSNGEWVLRHSVNGDGYDD